MKALGTVMILTLALLSGCATTYDGRGLAAALDYIAIIRVMR